MTPDHWQRLQDLVETARTQAKEERAPFLRQSCADDSALLSEVESLLKLESRAEAFLETPSADGVAVLFAKHDANRLLGRRIGHFELTGILGYGGMGVVYRAVQENPRREVALKIVRTAGPVDPRQLKLHEREVRSLARLRHPAIAAIHEAGSTDDGQHYFAMELVAGVPLTEFARREALVRRDRLELFCTICDAIQYAHQRGVIHRDLKPSNLLIDADGNPKVLDFGLAKITDADVAVTTLATDIGKVQGTLAYMSPEQARGRSEDIDSRSDVYSLGVMLFELLTDQLPYDVSRTVLPDAIRVICDEPPQRPSAIHRALRGDLETIALKALAKEPDRRYATAAALAEDVRRYLTDQPIIARPPSATYQLRKLVARHKVPFALLTVVFVLVLGFGIAASVLYADARAARDAAQTARTEADHQREVASAVNEFLLNDMLASTTPEIAQGHKVTVEEVLQAASKRIGTAFVDQPETEAAVRTTIGNTYVRLGLLSPAEEQFRSAYALRRQSLGEEHGDTLDAATALALHLRRNAGGMDEVESLLRHVLDVRRRSLGERHPEALRAKHNLIAQVWARDKARVGEVETGLRQIIEICRQVLGSEHEQTLESVNTLAVIVMAQLGDYGQAHRMFSDIYEIRKRTLGEDDPATIAALERIEEVASYQGNYAEAGRYIQRMLDIRQRTLGPLHPETLRMMQALAISLDYQRRPDDAEPLYRRTLELHREVFGAEHPETLRLMYNFADFLSRVPGAFDEAAELLQTLIEVRPRVIGERHFYHRQTLAAYAWLFIAAEPPDRRDPERALMLAKEAEAGLGESPILDTLATAYLAVGDVDTAVEIEKRQVAACTPAEFPLRTEYEIRLIHMLRKQGNREEADALLDEVIERTRTAHGDARAALVRSMTELALELHDQGRFNLCADFCREVTLMRLGLDPPEDPMLGHTIQRPASVLLAGGDHADVANIVHRCLEIRLLAFPEGHRAIVETSGLLSGLAAESPVP